MSRWILVLLSSVLATGCALFFPEEKELTSVSPESAQAEQQEIERHLDNFLAGGDLNPLNQYLADAPGSKQHAAIRRLLQELQQCRTEHHELTAKLESSRQLNDDLENRNLQLLETIEQLKSLLIQLEQRVH
jgi:hypothetical protein